MKKKLITSGVVLFSTVLLFSGCSKQEEKGTIENGQVTETSTSLSDGESVDVDQLSLKDDGYFKEIVTGKEDPKIKFEAVYDTDWSDSSWENVDFTIDKAKLVEVDKIKDKDDNSFKGVLALHYTLENKSDEEVSIHPDKATVVLNDGTEIDGSAFIDYWEDVFAKDKKKDGYVHFKFTKIDQVDNVKNIKMTFKGHKKGSEETKVEHEYNVDLPLELAK